MIFIKKFAPSPSQVNNRNALIINNLCNTRPVILSLLHILSSSFLNLAPLPTASHISFDNPEISVIHPFMQLVSLL